MEGSASLALEVLEDLPDPADPTKTLLKAGQLLPTFGLMRDDGKTSAVHFLHFTLLPEQIAQFRDPATTILIGSDHESYAHMAILSPATRAELSRDFA